MNQFPQRKKVFLGFLLFTVILVTGSILYTTKTPKNNITKYSNKIVPVSMNTSFLIKNQDKALTDLVTNYYNAILSADKKSYDKITVDDDSIDCDILLRKMEYIIGYNNQEIYVTQGSGNIDLVAYIVYDLEINSIKTPAPSIDQLLITDVNGEPKLYFNKLALNETKQIEIIRNHEEVKTLIQKVNNDFEAVIQSDSQLFDFYKTLAERTAKY